MTRKIKKDGARYFGPFMGGVPVNSVLELINFVFGVRPCDKKLSYKPVKPCLNYHIKKCSAPCAGLIGKDEYREKVTAAIDFLSGDIAETEKLLKEKMMSAAEREEFELALKLKGFTEILDKIGLKRITSLNRFVSADVIAYSSNGVFSAINLLIVRNGRMIGGKHFSFESGALSESDALREFILSYYKNGVEIPDEIIVRTLVADGELLSEYFKREHGKTLRITVAKAGVKKKIADMADVNAKEHLETAVGRIKHKNDMTVTACARLRDILGLKNFPKRMECYDISNVSGVDKVGSMVVFSDGEPNKDAYRRFKIKTVEGANDFMSLKEVLSRRIERLRSGDEGFSKPDLIIIDGGKGQLSSIKEVFDEYGIEDIDLISLAKREEEVFLTNRSEPVIIDKSDYCLKMLQRIRDEAHRFAITYFRSLHGKNSMTSVLDKVEGLGMVKRRALMEKFRDLNGLISADKEQLKEVSGVGDRLAESILNTLKEEGLK